MIYLKNVMLIIYVVFIIFKILSLNKNVQFCSNYKWCHCENVLLYNVHIGNTNTIACTLLYLQAIIVKSGHYAPFNRSPCITILISYYHNIIEWYHSCVSFLSRTTFAYSIMRRENNWQCKPLIVLSGWYVCVTRHKFLRTLSR